MPLTVTHQSGVVVTEQQPRIRSYSEQRGKATGLNAHAEGYNTVALAPNSHAEGDTTQVTTFANSGHAEGVSTYVSALGGHAEGANTNASVQYSHAGGRYSSTAASAQFARASDCFSTPGDAQWSVLTVQRTTTDATPGPLTAVGNGFIYVPTDARVSVHMLRVSRAHRFTIDVVARRSTGTLSEGAAWSIRTLAVRDSTGPARFIGTPIQETWADPAAATWAIALSIDSGDATYNFLRITATGEAGKTIRWVAKIDAVEVG